MRLMQKLPRTSISWHVRIIFPAIRMAESGKLRRATLKNSSDIYMV